MEYSSRKLSKFFQKQYDYSDCGVACLSTLINYYGGRKNIEELRELSGTTKQGTTFLGLYQGAKKAGLKPEGLEADINWLQSTTSPVILHVLLDERLQHYVICFGYKNSKFIIGDPGKGIVRYTANELAKIWESKALLKLTPDDNFQTRQIIKKEKIKWFKKLIRDDIGLLSILFVLSFVLSVLGLSMSIFSQKLVDEILPSNNNEKLILGLSLLFLLLIARSWLGYIGGFFGLRQSKDFNNRLIGYFYNHLLYLPKSFFDHRRIGELVSRMNDTSRIQSSIIQIFVELLNSILIVVAGLVVLFIYSTEIGYIALLSIPAYTLISIYYHNKIVTGQHDVMAAEAHKSSNYVSTMQGIDAIKGFHKEESFASINKKIFGHLQEKAFALGKTGINLNLVTDVFNVLISIALLAVGSWFVFSEKMTIGALMAVLGITTTIFPAISSLAFANISLQGAKVAFDRMSEFTTIEREYDPRYKDIENNSISFQNLEVNNLSFRFPGRKQILKKINLSLNKDEIISILGENGGGKSTLLNLLQGFYRKEEGEIFINGQYIENIPIPILRNSIGIMPQNISIFNGTLIDNITLGGEEKIVSECISFCKKSGFEKYFGKFPQGYFTLLGEEGINISGGQKQLIGLCRAMFRKPSILLLDEPTAAMDKDTEDFALALIRKYSEKCGIILVTHQLKVVNIADRVYVLQKGEIQASGNQKELLESDNLYSQSYNEITKIPVTK